MASSVFPINLSGLIKDFDKTFWNGDGQITINSEELMNILKSNPGIAMDELKKGRLSSSESTFLSTTISISLNHQNKLSLGAMSNASEEEIALTMEFTGGAMAHLVIVFDEPSLDSLPDFGFSGLKSLLKSYIVS